MKNQKLNQSSITKLDVYLRALSIEKKKLVSTIITNTPPTEERWMKLKSFFMQINPVYVDNLVAWNIYKLSI